MKMRFWLAGILAAAVLAASVSSSIAQTSAAPPQATNPLAAPRKAVLDAQSTVNGLNKKIAQIHLRIQEGFESRADWVAATKAVADAQAQYDAAQKPVMDALHANPDYQQLVANRKAAQDKLDELKAQPQAVDSEGQQAQEDALGQAAGEVVNDGYAILKMEREARDGDSTLTASKAQLSDAKTALEALQEQVSAAMEADPEYQTTQTALASAQQQLATARAALIAAENAQRPTPTPAPRSSTYNRGANN
jgi:DNA repair exonuclease SbcCD ATPase subunit